jgi:hypothetical protein
MPPDPVPHWVVPIEVTVVITAAAFLIGFLVNSVTMRSMFVSAKSCSECRTQCLMRRDSISDALGCAIAKLEKGVDRLNELIFKMHGEISVLNNRLSNRLEREEGDPWQK